MARNITTTGFRFIVEGAGGATTSIAQIERATQKLDLAFAKSVATGTKLGPSLTGALAGAMPGIGALQLGALGVAASLADKLLPILGQTASHMAKSAIDAMGFGLTLRRVTSELGELQEAWRQARGETVNPLFADANVYKDAAAALKARADIETRIDDEARAANEAQAKRASDNDRKRAQEGAARLRAELEAIDAAKRAAEASEEQREIKRIETRLRRERETAQLLADNRKQIEAQERADKVRAEQEMLQQERALQAAALEAHKASTLAMVAEVRAKQEAATAAMIERQGAMTAAINITADATATWVRAVVSGQQSMAEATEAMAMNMLSNVIQMSLQAIQAAAVRAAADAFATSSGYAAVAGPAGVALAAGTAAAFFGAAMAYQSQLPQLATGGLVMGGIPGRDSVQAMLQPGEFVIPARETSLLRAMMGRNAGGGGTTIVINNTIPDSRATERMVRDQIIPAQRRLARLGGR